MSDYINAKIGPIPMYNVVQPTVPTATLNANVPAPMLDLDPIIVSATPMPMQLGTPIRIDPIYVTAREMDADVGIIDWVKFRIYNARVWLEHKTGLDVAPEFVPEDQAVEEVAEPPGADAIVVVGLLLAGFAAFYLAKKVA